MPVKPLSAAAISDAASPTLETDIKVSYNSWNALGSYSVEFPDASEVTLAKLIEGDFAEESYSVNFKKKYFNILKYFIFCIWMK